MPWVMRMISVWKFQQKSPKKLALDVTSYVNHDGNFRIFCQKTRYHDAVNATSYTTLLWKGSHKSAKKLGIKHAVNDANDLIFVWKFQQKSPKKLGTNMFWVSQVTWITMEISTYFAKKARYDDCCFMAFPPAQLPCCYAWFVSRCYWSDPITCQLVSWRLRISWSIPFILTLQWKEAISKRRFALRYVLFASALFLRCS